MKLKKIRRACAYACEAGYLVHVVSASDSKARFAGYIVSSSDQFAVLHYVDTSSVIFNGYIVFPVREILRIDKFDAGDSFIHRALEFKGLLAAKPQNIEVDSFEDLLASIDAHFPLLALYIGRSDPRVCYIGRVAKLTEKSVSLREIDKAARWIDVTKYKYRDITRIDFADGYEDALWRVSEYERSVAEKAKEIE